MTTETSEFVKIISGDEYKLYSRIGYKPYPIYEIKEVIDKNELLYQTTTYNSPNKKTIVQFNDKLPVLETVFVNGRVESSIAFGYNKNHELIVKKGIVYNDISAERYDPYNNNDDYKTILETFEGYVLDDNESYTKIEIEHRNGRPTNVKKTVEKTKSIGEHTMLTEVFINDSEPPSTTIEISDSKWVVHHPDHGQLDQHKRTYSVNGEYPFSSKAIWSTFKNNVLIESSFVTETKIKVTHNEYNINGTLIERVDRHLEYNDKGQVSKIRHSESLSIDKGTGLKVYKLNDQDKEIDTFVKITELTYE